LLSGKRLGYVLTEFPVLRETFVLREVLAMEAMGAQVTVFAFRRPKPGPMHEDVARLRGDIIYLPRPGLLSALLWYAAGFARRPRTLGSLTALVLRSSWRQPVWLAKSLFTLGGACYFAYRARQRGIEHLHAHFATMATLGAMTVARMLGATFSFTAHAHDIHLNRTLLSEKLEAARLAVTISEYNRAFLAEHVPNADIGKVHVVHCGVDTSRFAPRSEPTGKPVLLSVAGLVEFKGLCYLIEACRILAQRDVAFECRIVGDGPLRGSLGRQISAAGLQGKVRLLGAMTTDGVIAQHAATLVYVQPSIRTDSGRQDGIPNTLMEAMASGLPVVSTTVSGIPELVQHEQNGLLVPPRDPVALADAIERLLADADLRRRLGAAARRTVQAEFDLAKTTRQFGALLRAALT
jgi:colanic acid/amylovoran biosynthesis glycosyltransferase